MIKLGIVSVTYNSSTVIDGFAHSLISQDFKLWNLYVIDNCSTDNTLEQLSTYDFQGKVEILSQINNLGFAGGSNIGIQKALADSCDYVMLINNDVEFSYGFLSLMMHEMLSNNHLILAPKMNYFEPRNKIWAAGGGFIPRNAWAAYHHGENESDNGQYDEDCYCDFVPMCCTVINSRVFTEVGLLDEKYFLYSEDADWFYRAKLLGYKIRYFYQAVLYHKVSSLTGGATSEIGASFGTRNRVYFICKHFSGLQKYTYLVKYFIGMFISLLSGKYTSQEFKWRFKAFFDGFKV